MVLVKTSLLVLVSGDRDVYSWHNLDWELLLEAQFQSQYHQWVGVGCRPPVLHQADYCWEGSWNII